MRWRKQDDPVTPDVVEHIYLRDKGCVAALVFGEEGCRNMWGDPIRPELIYTPAFLVRQAFQIDHVKDKPKWGAPVIKRLTRRLRAPSDVQHLQLLCANHHLTWAGRISSRELSRARLDEFYA